MSTRLGFLLAVGAILVGCNPTPPEVESFGHFEGEVQAEWLDDRSMELLSDFHYVDPSDVRWTAPTGEIVDGASIPRGLWDIVGPPFVGAYRRASVIHDVGCVRRTRSMEDTHRAFYYACRLDGVPSAKALLMYWAVSNFAEPWALNSEGVDSMLAIQAQFAPSDSAFAAAAEYFEYYADSLSIESPDLADSILASDRVLGELRQLRPAELERRIIRDVRLQRYTIPQRLDSEGLRQNRIPNGFMESRRAIDPRAFGTLQDDLRQLDPDTNNLRPNDLHQIEQGRLEQRGVDG